MISGHAAVTGVEERMWAFVYEAFFGMAEKTCGVVVSTAHVYVSALLY